MASTSVPSSVAFLSHLVSRTYIVESDVLVTCDHPSTAERTQNVPAFKHCYLVSFGTVTIPEKTTPQTKALLSAIRLHLACEYRRTMPKRQPYCNRHRTWSKRPTSWARNDVLDFLETPKPPVVRTASDIFLSPSAKPTLTLSIPPNDSAP